MNNLDLYVKKLNNAEYIVYSDEELNINYNLENKISDASSMQTLLLSVDQIVNINIVTTYYSFYILVGDLSSDYQNIFLCYKKILKNVDEIFKRFYSDINDHGYFVRTGYTINGEEQGYYEDKLPIYISNKIKIITPEIIDMCKDKKWHYCIALCFLNGKLFSQKQISPIF